MLSRSLRANAIFSAATGAALVIASGPLATSFGVPTWTLVVVGAGLLPFAAFVWWVSTSPQPGLVRLIIGADALWVVSAFGFIVGFPEAMTSLGLWTLGLVSLVVADLAIAQGVGLRRARA